MLDHSLPATLFANTLASDHRGRCLALALSTGLLIAEGFWFSLRGSCFRQDEQSSIMFHRTA